MNIKNKQEIVQFLLSKHPHLRDDGNKLLASIWKMEVDGIDSMSAMEFLHLVAHGEVSTHESIRRASRKIQEETPHLRGVKRNKRLKHQSDVIDQLHEMADDLNN